MKKLVYYFCLLNGIIELILTGINAKKKLAPINENMIIFKLIGVFIIAVGFVFCYSITKINYYQEVLAKTLYNQ